MRLAARLQQIMAGFRRELNVYRRLLSHPRCPWAAKLILGLAVAYALFPIDIIPDFIPALGHLDDAVILPALVFVALRLVPRHLIEEVRAETSEIGGSNCEP